MRAAARAALREIVREEVQVAIERYLNPTFVLMIREGVAQMNQIFDAVIACDDKHDQLSARIAFLEKLVVPRNDQR